VPTESGPVSISPLNLQPYLLHKYIYYYDYDYDYYYYYYYMSGMRKTEIWSYYVTKKTLNDKFTGSHFDTKHKCDRQTARQTDITA